jgi:hypothetical protein
MIIITANCFSPAMAVCSSNLKTRVSSIQIFLHLKSWLRMTTLNAWLLNSHIFAAILLPLLHVHEAHWPWHQSLSISNRVLPAFLIILILYTLV